MLCDRYVGSLIISLTMTHKNKNMSIPYLLKNASVNRTASVERNENTQTHQLESKDNVTSHHIKLNHVHAQTCPFKGTLPAKKAQVQSVASGERKKKMIVIDLSSHKIVCTNVSIQWQLTG